MATGTSWSGHGIEELLGNWGSTRDLDGAENPPEIDQQQRHHARDGSLVVAA